MEGLEGLEWVGRPSWRAERHRQTHQEGYDGLRVVGRPSWRVVRGYEDFRRAGRGQEAILKGREGSRGPPRGPGGVGRPFQRDGSHWEDPVEGL